MIKADIQKNLDLATKFDNYVIKHPDTLVDIDGSPCVVMGEKDDKRFTEVNRELAESVAKEEGKTCHQVIHNKNRWIIKEVKPA